MCLGRRLELCLLRMWAVACFVVVVREFVPLVVFDSTLVNVQRSGSVQVSVQLAPV